jgi:hypothetical protein
MSDIFTYYGEPSHANVTLMLPIREIAAIAAALWVADATTLEEAGVAHSTAGQVGPIFDQFDAFLEEQLGANWLSLVLTPETIIDLGFGAMPNMTEASSGCRGSI